MLKIYFPLFLALFIASCQSPQPSAKSASGLRKIKYSSAEELARIRQAGAEIVVQEPDYVIIRVDSTMTAALALPAEPLQEKDLVQRLVYITLQDSTSVQQIVDAGLDLWETRGDTAIARAFDIQLEKLQEAGFSFQIIAADADKFEGRAQ